MATSEGIAEEPPASIHVLPQKPGQSGHTEVHCLEDACILVNVSSDPSSVIQEKSESILSDFSLQAYAENAKTTQGSEVKDVEVPEFDEYVDEFPYVIPENKEQDDSFVLDDCAYFMDYVSFAKELVSNIVDESEANIELDSINQDSDDTCDNKEHKHDDTDAPGGFRDSSEFDYIETRKSLILWPSIKEFSIEMGAYIIDEYLSNFDTEEDWMYVIYYQGVQNGECSDLHQYQAIYSLPTWKYPIAQATASIYFTIEVCKAKPPNCLVNVTYRYETFRKIYTPGIIDFQEKWLHYILDSKIKFFQTITY